jgi:hypothetical protein
MRAFERSGLTVPQFCERERVSTTTFYKWRERLTAHATSARVEFLEVGGGSDAGAVEVIAGGIVVRVRGDFDAATLNRVLDVLAARR